MKRTLVMAGLLSALLSAWGCVEDASAPCSELAVEPAGAEAGFGDVVSFAATGGEAPLTFTLAQNQSGASVHPETGLYQAGSLAGGLDIVEVTDAAGRTARALVRVRAPLSLSPAGARVLRGGQVAFAATGGRAPHAYRLWRNESGGAVDPAQGLYTAGQTFDVVDTVEVEDADGATARADVAVLLVFPLEVAPASVRVPAQRSAPLAVTGGTPPYAAALVQNQSLGSVGVSGDTVTYTAGAFTGGAAGAVDVIEVSDASSPRLTTQVTVTVPGLSVAPASASVSSNAGVTFAAAGGLPPYAWRLSANASGASVTAGGAYTSGFFAGTDVVEVTDANGASVRAQVTVSPVVVSGQTPFSWANLDSLDFDRTPVRISGGYTSPLRGDVFFEYMISCLMPPPPLPVTVNRFDALGLYDAGTNTAVDPRTVSYASSPSAVTIGSFQGQTQYPIANKTVCVRTREGFYVRMVFPSGHTGPCVYTIYR